MNGNMFDELRKLAEKDELSQDAANRLTLSALAELNKKMDQGFSDTNIAFQTHVETEEKRNEGVLELRDSVEDLTEAVTLLSQSVVDLNTELSTVKQTVDKIENNPLVAAGSFIKSKPKQAILWAFGIFVVFYLVAGFKLLSLLVVVTGSLFGLPQETIDWVLQWMGR